MPLSKHTTIQALQNALEKGETTAAALTDAALERIHDPKGEGARTFLKVYDDAARTAARLSDELRASGQVRSPLEGIPVSLKDLFDVVGDRTRGASKVLDEAAPATENALLVQRLIDAGAILIGRTNMTEFAFSGLGINPHYGTPRAPWNRDVGHIPGGSSSGAGVSVADGMCTVAIGTDTGGSIRIPATFCGLTGFKPTAERIPTQGVLPLAFSLDSSGPIGHSVTCCAITDSILSDEPMPDLEPIPYEHLRIAVPKDVVFNSLDTTVSQRINAAILALTNSGVQVERIEMPEFNQLAYINRNGGFVCAEAWALHRDLISEHQDLYDPRVAKRILIGKDQSAADYIDLLAEREQWIRAVEERLEAYDAFLMPTSPIVAPRISDLEDEEQYFNHNALILRNPSIVNFLNGCAVSLPCHPEGEAPVGLTLAAPGHHDAHLLQVAYTIEQLLRPMQM
ncbi:MAG TPA: amidase [Paenalcaligenes sp.]|nr:amidase [Paenalcaligenes sp.]